MKHYTIPIRCVASSIQTHSLQDLRQQAAIASKVFVQRDYTSGTICKFQTKFPSELETRVCFSLNTLNMYNFIKCWFDCSSVNCHLK